MLEGTRGTIVHDPPDPTNDVSTVWGGEGVRRHQNGINGPHSRSDFPFYVKFSTEGQGDVYRFIWE